MEQHGLVQSSVLEDHHVAQLVVVLRLLGLQLYRTLILLNRILRAPQVPKRIREFISRIRVQRVDVQKPLQQRGRFFISLGSPQNQQRVSEQARSVVRIQFECTLKQLLL